MRPSRSSQSCPQHSISKIQYCRTLGKNGGGSTAKYTCNPLIACVPTHPSGCSQESAAVAVSFQPMGHAVWYRVRAAEVPADSEVNGLSLHNLRLFPAGSGSHREISPTLARFIGSHLLGGAGSREDPPNRSHSAVLRFRFLHFSLFCVASKHLVSGLRASPCLGACRALVQEDSLGWREGGGPGQTVAASAGAGVRGGGALGTPWTRGLRRSPRSCSPIRARGNLPPAPPTAAHAGGARSRGRGQRRL